MNKSAVISFSGGLDSTALLINLIQKKYDIYALSFNYGQKHILELNKAKSNINYFKSKGFNIKHKILDISDSFDLLKSSLTSDEEKVPLGYYKNENMKSTVVPNRNAIFSSFSYAYALSIYKTVGTNIDIALGVHSGDHEIYPDCRLEFYEKLFEAFKIGNWDSDRIKYYLPYLDFSKSDIINDALKNCKKLNLDFDMIFRNTLTSYNPDKSGLSDGKTASDVERILAFHELNLIDPIQYNYSWEEVLKNALDLEKDFKKK